MNLKADRLFEDPIRIEHGELNFVGRSGAGYHTHIACQPLSLAFDIGCCTRREAACRDVLLTHVHQDHALGALRHIALRDMFGHRPSRIIVPEASAEDLRLALAAFCRLEKRDRRPERCIRGAQPGETFELGKGRRVEVFAVDHTITSIGFRVLRSKTVLKPEFRELTGPEIGAKVREGITVKDKVEEALVTYIGDSAPSTLDAHPEALASKVVFLEATYLDPKDRILAGERGHLHIEDLAERAKAFSCELLILKHFSLKHGRSEIEDRVAKALPESLRTKTQLLI